MIVRRLWEGEGIPKKNFRISVHSKFSFSCTSRVIVKKSCIKSILEKARVRLREVNGKRIVLFIFKTVEQKRSYFYEELIQIRSVGLSEAYFLHERRTT
jgi:hypothetical protein